MKTEKQLMVISDLDGTLLDHYSYQFDAAQPALALLADKHIPLILNSSKTAAEIAEIRRQLHNHQPFIAENGSGIYLPEGGDFQLIPLGIPRAQFLPVISAIRKELNLSFTGFSDMDSAQLQACTGLSEGACQRAQQRDFTEPVLWQDSDDALQQFSARLTERGLQVVRGGRFVHISGPGDKGAAIRWMRQHFQQQLDCEVEIIALGDSDNDLQMLAQADHPFLIRSPVHPPPATDIHNLKISTSIGPSGWNECICDFLEKREIL